MGSKKIYNGYKAYGYLERGVDYKAYDMVPDLGRVPAYIVPVSKAEEERAERLLASSVVISLHDHPMIYPKDLGQIFEFLRHGREHTAYEGLSVSGLDAVFDNMMDGVATITSNRGWKWTDIVHNIGLKVCDIEHQDFAFVCRKVADIQEAHETGRIAFVLVLESATMVENELDRIEILYGFGVRMMGLVYSESNMMGSGLKENRDGGLTQLGHEAVKRMNKIGMAIDVSHAGPQTALDIIEASERPVFITHAGAKKVWDTRRMMTDEVIRNCAAKGGVIGIEAAPHSTLSKDHLSHSLDSVMDHFKYAVDLVGIDHASFGPDTLFGDHVGVHHAFRSFFSGKVAKTGPVPYEEVEYVRGIENPAEAFPNIVRWLVGHGYSDEDIRKVIGGNVLRTLKGIWWR
jgi:membrane dipeptidase